jgi:anti-sigma B factor antagonist
MAANAVNRAPELRLESERKGLETIVRATGRITSTTSPELEQTLRDLVSTSKRVVLELTGVDYVDSSGLGTLMAVYMHAARTNCDLEIANPKPRIRDLFTRSRFASVFRAVQEAGERHDELLGMTPD